MRFLYTMLLFTSLEIIGNGLDDLSCLRSLKRVKRRLHGISLHNVNFYEPGKNRKRTQTFDTRFKERDQSVITNAHRLFLFFGSAQNP